MAGIYSDTIKSNWWAVVMDEAKRCDAKQSKANGMQRMPTRGVSIQSRRRQWIPVYMQIQEKGVQVTVVVSTTGRVSEQWDGGG